MNRTYFIESKRFEQIEPQRSFFERTNVLQIIGGALLVACGVVLIVVGFIFYMVTS